MATKFRTEIADDRVRFNWGYHDARFDIQHRLVNRERIKPGTIAVDGQRPLNWDDRSYCEGYHRGLESDLDNPEHKLSTWAWLDYAQVRG